MRLKTNCVAFTATGVVCNPSKHSVPFLSSMAAYGSLSWLAETVSRIKSSEPAAFFIASASDDAMKCFAPAALALASLAFVREIAVTSAPSAAAILIPI